MKYALTTRKDTTVGLLSWEISLLFFMIGCLGHEYPLPALTCLLILSSACIMMHDVQDTRRRLVFFCITGCLGFAYSALRMPPKLESFGITLPSANQQVSVSGCVAKYSWRFTNQLYVYAENIRITGESQVVDLPGVLLISVRQAGHAPFIGQHFRGLMKVKPVHSLKNPGCWDGETYWRRKGVYWRAYVRDMDTSIKWEKLQPSVLEKLRLNLRHALQTALSDGSGKALAMALLLGDKSHLDSGVYTLLQKAGLVHTLALSGLHLGFVASFGWGTAWLLGFLFPRVYLLLPRPKLAAILASPWVVLYMWLGGFTPSLLRAGIMLASWAFLLLCNKGRVLVDGVCLAVLLIMLVSPENIFSISFQFSVLAVTGIIFLVPPIQSWLQSHANNNIYWRIFNYGALILAVSIAANLAILPLQIWNFGIITIHLYYNILWLPILGFIVLPLGFSGLFLTQIPILAPLGDKILKIMGWILENGYTGLKALDEHGWLQCLQVLRPQWPEVIGFYILLILFLLVWRYRKNLQKNIITILAIGLILLCVPLFSATLTERQQKLRLLVVDTGMSQAVYIDFPGGKRILIDGGGSWSNDFDVGKAFILPVITWGMPPALDAVFLTHSDCDHLRGLLYPMETCRIGTFYFNGCYPTSLWDRQRLITALAQNNIPREKCCAGQRIILGKDIIVEILHPEDNLLNLSNNNRSLVLRLMVNGKGRVLIPGDIEQEGIANLLTRNQTLQADVLILPHHGSITSYSTALYDNVSPKVAIAAVGQGNRYGFPAAKVTTTLRQRGCPVLTTAKCGAIEITWGKNDARMNIRMMRDAGRDVLDNPNKDYAYVEQ
ncbi:MAG: DNA internalization-related competence protein ComEC/Rec2 [Desulfoplanes sp.]